MENIMICMEMIEESEKELIEICAKLIKLHLKFTVEFIKYGSGYPTLSIIGDRLKIYEWFKSQYKNNPEEQFEKVLMEHNII